MVGAKHESSAEEGSNRHESADPEKAAILESCRTAI
jgi:hypothetical protein